MPELAYPFALVGLAAGWLSDGLLANPAVGVALHNSQHIAAVIAGVVGAALGAVLTRIAAPRTWASAADVSWIRLTVLVALGGLVTGGAVGGIERDSMFAIVSGAFNGLISSIAFVPVCMLVLAAARRADRARLGSIVAGADRRAVWAILAAALSVTTLAAIPDWPASRYRDAAPPHAALGMAAFAVLLIVAVFLADAVALARVARVARHDMEPRDGEDHGAAAGIPAVDLGLGDQVMARLARGASAYRSRDRAVALLIGSVAEARAALRRALLRGAVGIAIAAAALVAHRSAAGVRGLVAYNEVRCAQRASKSCYRAGLLFLGDAAGAGTPAGPFEEPLSGVSPPDTERAEALLRAGCANGERRACEALVASLTARGVGDTSTLPYWYSSAR
jgi:hypothetical protein